MGSIKIFFEEYQRRVNLNVQKILISLSRKAYKLVT